METDLKMMVVAIAVTPGTERTDAIDALAKDTAQELSATPIQDFQYVSREPVEQYERLMYSAMGTPKDDA